MIEKILTLLLMFSISESTENHVTDDLSQECKELFARNNPRSGCNYPVPAMSLQVLNTCDERCKQKTDDFCCLPDCDFELHEIFVDGKVKNENIAKLWINDTGIKVEDAWIPVLDKSIEKCFDTIPTISMKNCTTPENLGAIISCAIQFNFLECPSTMIFDSTEYEKVKKNFMEIAEKCGTKLNEIFFLSKKFWFRKRESKSSESQTTTTTQQTHENENEKC